MNYDKDLPIKPAKNHGNSNKGDMPIKPPRFEQDRGLLYENLLETWPSEESKIFGLLFLGYSPHEISSLANVGMSTIMRLQSEERKIEKLITVNAFVKQLYEKATETNNLGVKYAIPKCWSKIIGLLQYKGYAKSDVMTILCDIMSETDAQKIVEEYYPKTIYA